jgi:hypothetical protein
MEEAPGDGREPAEAWFDLQDHVKRYGRSGAYPKPLRTVLNRLLARQGYNQTLGDASLQELWEQTVPKGWRGNTRIKKYSRGVLEITVDNPITLQQLEFAKHQMVQQLQQTAPEKRIKQIRLSLG